MNLKLARHLMVTLVFLSACAGAPEQQVTPTPVEPFPLESVERVFIAGFDHISRKYIDEVDTRPLVLEGLRGLASLDPSVSIIEEYGFVTLRQNDGDIITMPTPGPNDTAGWAHLATMITLEASRNSTDILNAGVEDIYEAVFDGALSTLDINSRYAGADEAASNRAKREGFGGIGIRFKLEGDRVVVEDVFEGSPAHKAGILVTDTLLLVDDSPLAGLSYKEVTKALRGPVNSSISLAVMRNDNVVIPYEFLRAHIVQPTVHVDQQDGVLHVRVKSFNQGTASGVARALRQSLGDKLDDQDISGIILDLRGNPGGVLKQSIEVADTFLVNGDILDTLGRHPDSVQHYEAAGDDVTHGLPVVVLIDGRSASASEIVAAALQDRARAVILGTASYGKGTVQTVVRLPNNGEITLTWSRFMAPSGYALHGLGVYPVICTSGNPGDIRNHLISSLRTADKTVHVLESWRDTPLTAAETRRDLRTQCPPERHTGTSDVEIARTLINDISLYSQALELTTEPPSPTP
jgi:carboxyl-terminal processing protease